MSSVQRTYLSHPLELTIKQDIILQVLKLWLPVSLNCLCKNNILQGKPFWFLRLLKKRPHRYDVLLTSQPSLFYNTSTRHERHECAWATQMQHECDMNNMSETQTTRVQHKRKFLILITTGVKTFFQTPVLAIWQMKYYNERNNVILRTTLWKRVVPMTKCVWKVHHKSWTL